MIYNLNNIFGAEHKFDRNLDSNQRDTDDVDARFMNAFDYWEEELPKLAMKTNEKIIVNDRKVPADEYVFDRIAGNMTTDDCIEIGKAVLKNDPDQLMEIMRRLTKDAIKETAMRLAEDDL